MTRDSETRREKRLLRGISRRAAGELNRLREIPDTPAGLDYFYDVMEAVFIENAPERLYTETSWDRPVIGVCCMVVPEELIYAAGAVPVRLCAGIYESAQLGEDRVPRDGCPLVKSSMGLSMQRGLEVFDRCDVVIIPTTCDAKRKLGEELSAFREVWMLETPHLKDSASARHLWREQMYALKLKLESYVGNKKTRATVTSRQLAAAIEGAAQCQNEVRRFQNIRAATCPVIWGRQATVVMNAYAYAPRGEWTRALKRLNDELEAAMHRKEPVSPPDAPRILIAGSPAIFPNLKLPSLVEEMGGVVVFDESCAGDRYLRDPVGSTEKNLTDQMTAVAARYLAPCVCPSFAPNDDRRIFLQHMASDYAVDGVLYQVLKGCVIYDFELFRIEKAMKERGLPLIRIETDYNPEDVEQLRTRIEAFIEMLHAKKRKREQKTP